VSHSPFIAFLLFLLAAVIAVPIFRKLKLGAILGYLTAGIVMGPYGFSIIADAESLLHFSEIGVVLLLFVIGLELNPEKLWTMRHHIAGLGVSQLLISATVIAAAIWLMLNAVKPMIVIGLALGLSSTAFAIQLMAEKGLLASPPGRRGFAILLLQDLAVIPILFLVETLSAKVAAESVPWWWGVLAVTSLLLIGRFGLNPMLSMVSRYGSRESMTASALFIVIGSAVVMQMAGLSMGMGAFIAGIMLANSHFRHQLESDIEPFKGLTLGVFFIAIGMTLNLELLQQEPLYLVGLALLLMTGKSLIIMLLLKLSKIDWRQGIVIGLMLSQGGEFAFVVMKQALVGELLAPDIAERVNLIVGLSMALTAPLVAIVSQLVKPSEQSEERDVDIELSDKPEVLILGFGRFGQTTGRILAANKIPFIALDKDAQHIDFVKKFGNKAHFGDATRLDVLKAAGIEHVRVVLVGLVDSKSTLEVINLIKEYYPEIKIVARAKSRADYWALKAGGGDVVIRELFKGSLEAAINTLQYIGFTGSQAIKTAENFEDHDEYLLADAMEHRDNPEKVMEIGRQGRKDLERIFSLDNKQD
jgi:CPA2 family monovalent cation:H+ antiporter-2